jgi:hypothetical protein
MAPADDRLTAQAELILDNLSGSAASPSDWSRAGDVEYFYRQHSLLVMERDLERVLSELGRYFSDQRQQGDQVETSAPAPEPGVLAPNVRPVVGGCALVMYADPLGESPEWSEVPAVLNHLDAVFGVGVARPDHVLYVTSHPCPATEPEEVPAGTVDPFPASGDDHGCNCTSPDCGHAHRCRSTVRCSGKGVFVTVCDLGWLKGADAAHSWLSGVDGDPENPLNPGGTIRPYAGHGTFVAGCVRVTAPDASIYVERDVEVAAASSGATYESDVVLRLAGALTKSPDIVVFEFTTPTRKDLSLMGFDGLYEARIRHIKGLAFVAPAGNEGKRDVQWPAAYPWVVSVGALSANWRSRAHFSNFGGWVDVYAPGEDLVNAFATGPYKCSEPPNQSVTRHFAGMARWSGTSFSTPLVAGLIASRMSCTGENGQQAAGSLLRLARSQAMPGIGAVLFPGQACCEARCGCGC